MTPTRTHGVPVKEGNVVKDHHIYKAVWTPMIGEELHTKLEKDNEHDEHTVAVTLDGHTAGHLHLYPVQYLLCCGSFKATTTLEALLQQCKTSAYKTPLYLCGHMECLPRPPYGHIRGYLVCIGDPAFIRGRHLIEEIL